jgi:hypothetical protein
LPSWLDRVQKTKAFILQWARAQSMPLDMELALVTSPRRVVSAFVLDQMAHGSVALMPSLHVCNVDDALFGEALRAEPAIILRGIELEGAVLDDQLQLVDCHDSSKRTKLDQIVVRVVVSKVPCDEHCEADDESDDELEALMAVATRKNVFLARSRPMSASRSSSASIRPLSRRPPSPSKLDTKTGVKQHSFYVPLYKSASRMEEGRIGLVRMAASHEHNHWVLRGTALHSAPSC